VYATKLMGMQPA